MIDQVCFGCGADSDYLLDCKTQFGKNQNEIHNCKYYCSKCERIYSLTSKGHDAIIKELN